MGNSNKVDSAFHQILEIDIYDQLGSTTTTKVTKNFIYTFVAKDRTTFVILRTRLLVVRIIRLKTSLSLGP